MSSAWRYLCPGNIWANHLKTKRFSNSQWYIMVHVPFKSQGWCPVGMASILSDSYHFQAAVLFTLMFENHSHIFPFFYGLFISLRKDQYNVWRCINVYECVCVCLWISCIILWVQPFSCLICLYTSLQWNEFTEVPDWLIQSCDLVCQSLSQWCKL